MTILSRSVFGPEDAGPLNRVVHIRSVRRSVTSMSAVQTSYPPGPVARGSDEGEGGLATADGGEAVSASFSKWVPGRGPPG